MELVSSDGKEIHIKQNPLRKPPLPHAATSSAPRERRDASHPSPPRAVTVTDGPQMIQVISAKVGKPAHVPDKKGFSDYVEESITLFTLLWIPEGKGVTLEGSHGNKGSVPGIVARSNLYLVCRMFWCEDTSISAVCWGTSEPQFGFRQVGA